MKLRIIETTDDLGNQLWVIQQRRLWLFWGSPNDLYLFKKNIKRSEPYKVSFAGFWRSVLNTHLGFSDITTGFYTLDSALEVKESMLQYYNRQWFKLPGLE